MLDMPVACICYNHRALPLHPLESERLSASQFIPPWVNQEHLARYQFAARYVKDKLIVDCASGNGLGTSCFLQAGPKYIYAFDVAESAVETARNRCGPGQVEFQVSDALHLPLADGLADVFISLETIEHLEDDSAFVKEAARILKPDGLFICSTPNRVLTNPGLSLEDQPFNLYHLREYTLNEFDQLLKGGFSEVTIYGQNPRTPSYAKILNGISRLLPGHGGARINQLVKLPRFIYYNRDYATVVERRPHRIYEYLIAVCRNPHKS